jgi:hypothetical protein
MERDTGSVLVNFGRETQRVPVCARAASAHSLLYATEGASLDGAEVVLPPESLAIVTFVCQ